MAVSAAAHLCLCSKRSALQNTAANTRLLPALPLPAHLHTTTTQVQQDEYERQRLQQLMQQQQMQMSSSMVAEQVAPAAVASGPPAASWANHGIMPISLSLPAAMPEATTLAGAVSQSAQSLLQHSLSASLSSQTIAAATNNVFAPSSCPDLPQVRVHACVYVSVNGNVCVCWQLAAAWGVLRQCLVSLCHSCCAHHVQPHMLGHRLRVRP